MAEHEAIEGLDLVGRIMDLVKAHMSEALRAEGARLQLMEAHILRIVLRRDGCSQLDVVRETRRDKAQIGKLVATLVDRGLLMKAPDPDDGRRQRLTLTPSGKIAARRSVEHRAAVAKLLFADTPDDDAERLLAGLRQLEDSLARRTPSF